MSTQTLRRRASRPVILRAETPYNGGTLVLSYTNGKRAVLFNDGYTVTYAMWNNTVSRLVKELESKLIAV